jgi:hypothetical protein
MRSLRQSLLSFLIAIAAMIVLAAPVYAENNSTLYNSPKGKYYSNEPDYILARGSHHGRSYRRPHHRPHYAYKHRHFHRPRAYAWRGHVPRSYYWRPYPGIPTTRYYSPYGYYDPYRYYSPYPWRRSGVVLHFGF